MPAYKNREKRKEDDRSLETGRRLKYEFVFSQESDSGLLACVRVLSTGLNESAWGFVEYRIYGPLKWDVDRTPIEKYWLGSFSEEREPSPEEVAAKAAKKVAERAALDAAEAAYEAWVPQAYPVLEKALSHLQDRVRLQKQPWDKKITVKVISKSLEKLLGGQEFSCSPTTDWARVLAWLEEVRKIAPPPLASGKPKPVLKRQ